MQIRIIGKEKNPRLGGNHLSQQHNQQQKKKNQITLQLNKKKNNKPVNRRWRKIYGITQKNWGILSGELK